MAMNPAVQPVSTEAPAIQAAAIQAAAKAPAKAPAAPVSTDTLKVAAPVSLASPDNAPLVAQLAALQQAQDAPTTSARIKTVLQRAFALLGTPYRWGGTSPDNGFDCSGLVGYVFRTIGIDLPRVSRAMANEGTPITDRNALTEGDLVFFGRRGRVDHVGIYIGDGKFLHAPRTGRDVTVSTLSDGYWSQKYMEARRIATGS
ncbi:C40 family peptidase [Thermomonas sp.]|uniref:C40 family peptidase n=1 Tax=Thermomonas sp. TaxID=1971895 RepID=UPI0024893842|nr:C40 family peptidase [Thermomonas sp.]MDI1253919.1 C40 family peptidase [Thermomonas sp.]